MTHKVGPKGQVVIPKTIRDELGIEPGDRVDVERQQGEVVIRRHREAARERQLRIKALRGRSAGSADGGTAALEAQRREDRGREERTVRDRLDDRP